ncbi:hypothetical protein [Rosenbergiella epipactidis]|uniref:hypothetical protein n=1 Tax=Rosenbergiella epipactidis TaxID=1544694 RepID=UPI001F4D6AA8|nr:hypothetical protein [Rosenbergiella epipactidis]
MKVRLLTLLFFMHIPWAVYAAPKTSQECYVFINSSIPEQFTLFYRFNEEYYLSRTLQDKAKITFINISKQVIDNNYVIPIINDTQGIWVRKFKPQALPTIFSLNQHRSSQRIIETTEEIRQCLQGK